MARHEHAHEVLGLAIGVFAGDDDFVDVVAIEVADGALDERAFLIDERRRAGAQVNSRTLSHMRRRYSKSRLTSALVREAPAVRRMTPMPSGTSSSCAIAFKRLRSLGVGDLAGNAAAARGVRHQHGIAAGEREIGRERRAFVAALFLDDLHEQNLAALDDFLDFVLTARARAAGAAFPPSRRRRYARRARSSSSSLFFLVVIVLAAASLLALALGLVLLIARVLAASLRLMVWLGRLDGSLLGVDRPR